MSAVQGGEGNVSRIDEGFLVKVFAAFAALALLSVLLSFGGKWVGKSIALAGHTEDATPREVVIGNNVLSVPSNAIRFERERRDGVAASLHLYLHWPDMHGYSAGARDEFNHAEGRRNILFLSFEPQMMSRDMSGRFEPIYKSLIEGEGGRGPAGLMLHRFSEKSGYVNEMLAIGPEEAGMRFVARCLTGPEAAESLAECERDLLVGDELALTYRFPGKLLEDWRRLDAGVRAYAGATVRTGE